MMQVLYSIYAPNTAKSITTHSCAANSWTSGSEEWQSHNDKLRQMNCAKHAHPWNAHKHTEFWRKMLHQGLNTHSDWGMLPHTCGMFSMEGSVSSVQCKRPVDCQTFLELLRSLSEMLSPQGSGFTVFKPTCTTESYKSRWEKKRKIKHSSIALHTSKHSGILITVWIAM